VLGVQAVRLRSSLSLGLAKNPTSFAQSMVDFASLVGATTIPWHGG